MLSRDRYNEPCFTVDLLLHCFDSKIIGRGPSAPNCQDSGSIPMYVHAAWFVSRTCKGKTVGEFTFFATMHMLDMSLQEPCRGCSCYQYNRRQHLRKVQCTTARQVLLKHAIVRPFLT